MKKNNCTAKNKLLIEKIQNSLEEQGFFQYKNHLQRTQKKFQKLLKKAISKRNPQNLYFHNSWQQITNFGPDRQLLLIELGGTFLKLFLIEIKKNKVKILQEKKVNFYRKITYTPKILFQELQKHLDKLLNKAQKNNLEDCVFVFTFPIKQIVRPNGLIDGICLQFGKNHRSKNIIGAQIGQEFEKYLRQNNYPKISINLTNDSPLSLLAAKKIEFQNKQQRTFSGALNLIVGTGTNLSFAFNKNKQLFICNTEFGTFDFIPRSKFDYLMDQKLPNKGAYATEKMFAGAWRALLFKTIVQFLFQEKILFSKDFPDFKINMEASTLNDLFDRKFTLKSPLAPLHFIWKEIAKRGGFICGLALAESVKFIKKKAKHSTFDIIEVGGVLEHSQVFHQTMISSANFLIQQNLTQKLTSQTISYNLYNPKNQSVFGAVIFDLLTNK